MCVPTILRDVVDDLESVVVLVERRGWDPKTVIVKRNVRHSRQTGGGFAQPTCTIPWGIEPQRGQGHSQAPLRVSNEIHVAQVNNANIIDR